MKAVVVSSSLLLGGQPWDVRRFTGSTDKVDADIERAFKALRSTLRRIRTLRAERRAVVEGHEALVREGKVRDIKSGGR